MITGARLEAWLLSGLPGTRKLSPWRALATLVVTGSPHEPVITEVGGDAKLIEAASEAFRRVANRGATASSGTIGSRVTCEGDADGFHIALTARTRPSHPLPEPAVSIEVRLAELAATAPDAHPSHQREAQRRVDEMLEALERSLRELLPVTRIECERRSFSDAEIVSRLAAADVVDQGHPLFGMSAQSVAMLRGLEGAPVLDVPADAGGGQLGTAGAVDDETGGGSFAGSDDGGGGHL